MAIHTIASSFEVLDPTGESIVDRSRSVPSLGPDGEPEINVGAFRGLAFALIFETVLVLLGGVAWQIFRTLH